jgi:hypothetical protein
VRGLDTSRATTDSFVFSTQAVSTYEAAHDLSDVQEVDNPT